MSARAAILKKLAASPNLAVEQAVTLALVDAAPHEQAELADVLLERNHRPGWITLIRSFHHLADSIRQKLLSRPRDLFGPLADTMQDIDGPARENVISIVQKCTDLRLAYLLAEALMDIRPEVRTLAGNSLLEIVRRYWTQSRSPDPAQPPVDPEENAQLKRAIDMALRQFKTHRQSTTLTAALINERLQDAPLWAYFQDLYDDRTRAATIILRAPAEPALVPALTLALGSPLKPAAIAGIMSIESPEMANVLAENAFRLADPALRDPARGITHLKLLNTLRKTPPWNLDNWAQWLRLIESVGLQPADRLAALNRVLEAIPDLPEAVAWKISIARAFAQTDLPDAGISLALLAKDADERVARSAARHLIRGSRLEWRHRAADELPKNPHPAIRRMAELVRLPNRETDDNQPRTMAVHGFERTWNAYQNMPPALQHTTAKNVATDPALAEQLRAKFQGNIHDISQALRMVYSLPDATAFRAQIISLCGHPEPRIASMAVRLVGRLEDPKLKDLLEAATHHPDSRVRANAVESMEELHIADRSQRVLAMLNSRHSRERANAIKAIGAFNFQTANECLSRMLTDSSPLHRLSALWVVGQLNLTDIMRQVFNIARRDPNLRVRNRALEMMEALSGSINRP